MCVENSVFAGAIFPQKPPGHTIVPRYVVLRSISVRMIAVLGVTMQTPTRVFVFVGSVPHWRQGFWVLLRSLGQYWSCCQFRRFSIIRVHFRMKIANGPTNDRVTRSILHADFTTFWLELLLYVPRLTPCIRGDLNLSLSPSRFLVVTTMFLEDCRRLLARQVPNIADDYHTSYA